MSSFGFPLQNPPFFPFSSVRVYLGPPRYGRTKTESLTLGKRDRGYFFSPILPDERPQKRRRIHVDQGDQAAPINQNDTKAEPWHSNDIFLRKFNLQELKSIVDPDLLNSPSITFDTCPIHPILHSLVDISNYVPNLLPALRLATRFLTSRHTLTFFHTLINTPLTALRRESAQFGVLLTHFTESAYTSTGLPDDQKMLTIQAIIALLPHLTFQISPDPRLSSRWAYTERVTPPQYLPKPEYENLARPFPIPADLYHIRQPPTTQANVTLRCLNFTGTNALINLSPSFLRILHPNTSPAPSQEQRLRCAYMLAITLIHELAHAVYMLRFPAQLNAASLASGFRAEEYEPFCSTHRKCELGHALEVSLFSGGKILSLGQRDDFSIGLGWQRWPGADELFFKDASGVIRPLQRVGRKAPKWETVYAVRHEWVRTQFGVEFWDRLEFAGLGGGLLKVEKVLGSRLRNWDFDYGTMGDGLEDGCSSAERGEDADGVVRPGQEMVYSSDDDDDDDDES